MSKTTFKDAWGVLQRHAQTLRTQSEPNIDDLLRIVTESVTAYQVCKERVDAVERALEAALQGSGEGWVAPSAGETSTTAISGGAVEFDHGSDDDRPPF